MRKAEPAGGAEDLDRLLDGFESAWQRGAPPAIPDLLPPTAGPEAAADPRRRELLQELIKIDLEYHWRRADAPADGGPPPARPRLEDYVEQLPELGPLPGLPVELVGEEYRVRQRWGDRPGHAEYAGRFPGHGAALAEALARVDAELAAEQARVRRTHDPDGLPRPVQLCCPYCRQAIEADADLLPRHLACPGCGGTFSVEALSAAAGRAARPPAGRLGRYELGELLGTGAFGSVWRAHDAKLAREVAVKVPRSGQFSSPAEEERFLREARSAAQLHHPGIVAVYDVGRDQETLFIVSELVRGENLAEWLKGGRPSFAESAELVAQVADALDYAHRQGVVHRDVKPSNILLQRKPRAEEGDPQPPPAAFAPRLSDFSAKVTDFGLALRDAGEVTMTLDGQVLGTPAYMSPEQVCDPHAVDGRSDVYSLGVILYELLTGELPFQGVARMALLQVVAEDPRPPRRLNDKIPRDLETICVKCLAKARGRRYRTAAALAADLRRLLAGAAIRARPVSRPERLWLWAKRNPSLVVAGGVAAGALVAFAGTPAALALAAVTVGALLFALHKARAAVELARAVEDVTRTQQRTAAALHAAVSQCHRAREERDRAVAGEAQARRRFGRARELARAFLFDFPEKIAGAEGPAPARAFFVRAALAYLDGLAKEVGGDELLLRELAVAYARVGDVQGNAGDIAGALASHRKSLEIFSALARAHPDNAQAQRDVAASRAKVADLQRALDQDGADLADARPAPH
jgi:tRNA A-37 threonylcarbamoyl transferase component Bud32